MSRAVVSAFCSHVYEGLYALTAPRFCFLDAEYAYLRSEAAVRIPEGIDLAEAAVSPTVFASAIVGLV